MFSVLKVLASCHSGADRRPSHSCDGSPTRAKAAVPRSQVLLVNLHVCFPVHPEIERSCNLRKQGGKGLGLKRPAIPGQAHEIQDGRPSNMDSYCTSSQGLAENIVKIPQAPVWGV